MTLILNEIYLRTDPSRAMIVCSADTKITFKEKGRKEPPHTKVFRIPYLNACMSYWGNISVNQYNRVEFYTNWLPKFINRNRKETDLRTFANRLRTELNSIVDKKSMLDYGSGFHFSWFNEKNQPDFFHFSNCEWVAEKGEYVNRQEEYKGLSGTFLETDAVKAYGWDGSTFTKIGENENGLYMYRNGDIFVQSAAWEKLEIVFGAIFSSKHYHRPDREKDEDVIKYIRHKLKIVASMEKEWGKSVTIAAPFHIYVLRPRKNPSYE